MSATAQVLHSLHKPYAAMFLVLEAKRRAESDVLNTMNRRKKKDGPEKDALWSGAYQLEQQAEKHLEQAVKCGVLLFVSQPAAINAALALETQRRAAW